MEAPTLIILLCCSCYVHSSHHAHTIPVENYETELQNLGEHVEFPETPIKVVKITKTVAVKVPVPYPVKVVEKVPYPVHINKPYPVPVPQIVKIPHVVSPAAPHGQEALGVQDRIQNVHQNNDYQVQEDAPNGDSYEPESQLYQEGDSGNNQHIEAYNDEYSSGGSPGHTFGAPPQSYYGNSGPNDADSFESQSYDHAIREYLNKNNGNGNNVGYNNYNLH